MIGIFFIILKVIGIALLVILGILLFCILCILFAPISYRLGGSFLEEKKDARAAVSWAFFAVRFQMAYEYGKELMYSLRIFGLLIASNQEEETWIYRRKKKKQQQQAKKREKQKEKRKKQALKHKNQKTQIISKQTKKQESERQKKKDKSTKQKRQEKALPSSKTKRETAADEKASDRNQKNADFESKPVEDGAVLKIEENKQTTKEISIESKTVSGQKVLVQKEEKELFSENGMKDAKENSKLFKLWEKIRRRFALILQKLQRIKQAGRKILNRIEGLEKRQDDLMDRIEDIFDQYEKLESFYYQNETQYAMQKILFLGKKTLMYVLPRRCKGYVDYGFDDPSWTGKSYGILSVLGLATKRNFHLNPNFEMQILRADVIFTGRIRIFYFLKLAIIIFFDKKLKQAYQEGKKIAGGLTK